VVRNAVISCSVLFFMGCGAGLPKHMIISPQWVDDLSFESAAVAPELGFAVTLPDKSWIAKRSYVYGKLMSFELEQPRQDAVVKLLNVLSGEKAAGGPQAEAERLRQAYLEFGVEISPITASEDGRLATFNYEIRENWHKVAKRVIVVAATGAENLLLVFRGEWPPEAGSVMDVGMRTVVGSARLLDR